MRIGYIVQAHKEPELVGKLVRRVLENTDNIVAIYIDKRVNADVFKNI